MGGYYANVSLDDSILPVSANSTQGLLLVAGVEMVFECLGCEDAIVTVYVLHTDIESFGEYFESFLGFKSRLNGRRFLTMCMQKP